MAADEKQMDALDKLIASDPHANPVEGDQQAWLLAGEEQMKVARDALPKSDDAQ
jgi:hypothetical protein